MRNTHLSASRDLRREKKQNLSGWSVQIYDVSSSAAQEVLVGLFAVIDSVGVEAVNAGSESYLVVTCTEEHQARSVYELVTAVDARARLVSFTDEPALASPNVA